MKTESQRLDYIRLNQNKLRVEQYQWLMDYLNEVITDHNLKPGRMVILPSSFQGSPHALLQNYQDAMAIVAKYGKPDLFITLCNPKWIEITENLACGEQALNLIVLILSQEYFRIHKRYYSVSCAWSCDSTHSCY